MLTDSEKIRIVEQELWYISSIRCVLEEALKYNDEIAHSSEYSLLLEIQNEHIKTIRGLF